MENYVNYHLHSDYSLLDSTTKAKDYIKKAKEFNMKAIGFSEHGNIYNWIKKKQFCDEVGIKYLHGAEFYLTESLNEKIRDNYHTILYAKNYEGVLEINKLISLSNKSDHFYYKPRISFDEFLNVTNNIISISACMASPLNKLDRKNTYYDKLIKKYDFLEIQPHHKSKDQIAYNIYLYEISKKYNKNLILGTDTHEINKYKQECRSILKSAKNMIYDNEDDFNLTFRSYEELIHECKKQNCFDFSIYSKAIQNTVLLADTIEYFELDKSFKYPKLYDDEENEYINKVNEKLDYKIKNKVISFIDLPKYKERLNEEYVAFKTQGMFSYMLFMSELNTWCWDNNIPTGYGRGSCVGSLSAYILDITDLDPIKWNTIFSRFVNSDRISLADIDVDYSPEDREKVYAYITNRFGEDNVSYIVTFNTISEKGTISEITRALNYDFKKSMEIKNTFEENPEECRNMYPDIFKFYDGLIGTFISVGVHPCGFISSPITLHDNIGLYYDKEKYVSQCDMKAIDSLNYVKFDILGLKNIGIIKETYNLLNLKYKKSHEINWEDKDVWRDIITSPAGIFQFEGDYSFKLLKQFVPEKIDDMSLINASLRPSGESYRDSILNREFHHNPTKEIDDLLKNNYGFLVYQEDQLRFLQEICGLSGGEADTVRRCVDEDTLVTMANGNLKKIKNINLGDTVQSFNSNNISEHKKVLNLFNNGKKECYEVKTQHGNSILATGDHKVLTQRGWIIISDLSTSDYIMTPKKINIPKTIGRSNERLKESDMFLIGMLIGDGTLGDSDIRFTNSNRELIDKFKDCINNRLRNPNDCEFYEYIQNGVTVDFIYTIRITSKNYKKSITDLLNKHGLLEKSEHKSISDNLMCYPIGGKLSNLLAGLFSTDGGYNSQSNTIEYYSISNDLILSIKYLLLKYGIYSYIITKKVNGYNYNLYTLIIGQPNSLNIFKKEILKYMVGNKKLEFEDIINKNIANKLKYNFMLPNEYRDEILKSSKIYKKSIRSLSNNFDNKSDLAVNKNELGISDTKAQKIITDLYCPKTYEILFSEYIPVAVKEINYAGIKNVYDIEVEDNHNYIANNLIVHNCIGKKDEEGLNKMLPLVKEGYVSNSKKVRNVAEKEVEEFLKILQDSASYAFGFNHSTAYSMIGYTCGYLRYYYPLEFTTAFLNMAQNEDDLNMGQSLAELKKIKINKVTFGKSKSNYVIHEGQIYKGMKSIKFINETIPEELNLLYGETVFYKLIDKIKNNTSANSRQLETLIKINYFKEFGKPKKLLKFLEWIELLNDRKTFDKNNIDKSLEKYLTLGEYYDSIYIEGKRLKNELVTPDMEIIKSSPKTSIVNYYKSVRVLPYCTESEKQYKDIKIDKLLDIIWNDIPDEDFDFITTIQYELEFLGYIQSEIPVGTIILNVKWSGKSKSGNIGMWGISLRNGKEGFFSFKKGLKLPNKESIIVVNEIKKKEYKGRDSYEILSYNIIKE